MFSWCRHRLGGRGTFCHIREHILSYTEHVECVLGTALAAGAQGLRMFVVGCRTFYQIREHILSHKRTRRMCSLAVSCSRAVYWCGGACLSMCVCVHLCARARTRGRVGACACACACASAHMHARSRAHTRRTAHARRYVHAHRYTLACTHVQTRGVENGTERARAIEWEGVGWRVECVGERRTFICCAWVQRHAPLLSSCLAHSSLVLARFFFLVLGGPGPCS